MKLKSIEITNMHNIVGTKKVEFNDVTYLYGNNGAGKSTILQAVQLAILGYIPGYSKTAKDIFTHCNSATLKVSAEFDDGFIIERQWQQNGASVSATSNLENDFNITDFIGELELPIFNFSDFLQLTSNKMKDWFINFLPSTDNLLDWEYELKKSTKDVNILDKDLIKNTVESFNTECKGTDNLDSVRKANAWLKDHQSYIKGEISRTESTIQSLIYYDDEEVSGNIDDIIHECNSQIHDIEVKIKEIQNHDNIVQSNASVQNLIDGITCGSDSFDTDPKKAEIEAKLVPKEDISALKDKFNEINKQGVGIKDENIKLQAEISTKKSVVDSNGVCPYTKSVCKSIQDMITELQKEIRDTEDKISQNEEQMNKLRSEAVDLKASITDMENTNKTCESELDALRAEYIRKSRYTEQLKEVPVIPEDYKSVEEYQEDVTKLRDRVAKLSANKKYNELIDNLTNEKYKLESNQEIYKIWVKLTDANGLQTDMMNKPFKNLESDMTGYLKSMFGRDDVECKFVLSNKANSFDFGLVRDGDYISYRKLSSGEKTLYAFALMLCLTARTAGELKLICIDDFLDHLDSENVNHLFSTLKDIKDIQILMAGVIYSDAAKDIVLQVK